MKKLLALILAIVMCLGVFAACGDKADEEPSNSVTDDDKNDQTKPDDKKEDPADDTQKTVTLDKTDSYTLVIEKIGTAGDERMPVSAAAGTVAFGYYNMAGNKRNGEYVVEWASLGLSGEPWEYLGALVELDVSDPANPKILNTIVKSTWVVKCSDVTFPDDTTVKLPDGTTFDLTNINYGGLRNEYLINEGGWFIPKWDDKTTVTSKTSNIFTAERHNQNYYLFTRCPQFGQDLIYDLKEPFKVSIDTPTNPNTPTTPDTPVTPDTPAHTHEWDGGKVTKEATCNEAGVKTFTCACGETKTEAIAKTGEHKYDEGKKSGINTVFTCTVCGETKTEKGEPVMKSANILVVGGTTHTMVARNGDALLKELLMQDAGVTNVRVDAITVNGERGRLDQLFTYEKWDKVANTNNISGVATNEARLSEYNSIAAALAENAEVKYDYIVFAVAHDWNVVPTQPYNIREINSFLHFEEIIAKHNPDATIVVSVTPPMEGYVEGSSFGLYDGKPYPIADNIEGFAAALSAQGAAIANALNESEPKVKVVVADAAKGFMTAFNAGEKVVDLYNDGYTWPAKDNTKYPDENKFYYYPFNASAYLVMGTVFCEITGLDAESMTVATWSGANGTVRDINNPKEICDFNIIKAAVAEAIK